MSDSGRTHGVVLIGDDHPRAVRPADLELATDLGRRGASALERAQLWQLSQLQLAAEHHMVEVLQESIVPERLPVVEPAASSPPCTAPPTSSSTSAATGTTPSPSTTARSCSSSATSPATASKPRASWAGCATACAPTPSTTRIRPSCSGASHELLCAARSRLDGHRRRRVLPARHAGAHVVARRSSAAACVRTRRHDPLPRRRERDAARHARQELRDRAGRSSPTASLVVLYTDGLIERRDHLIDEGLDVARRPHARARATSRSRHLCAQLVDRSFASSPSADDICVLALRVTADAP